jgi:HSP20 family protein
MQQLASMEVDRLNRMFDRVRGGESGLSGWMPPVDIFEDEHQRVVIRAELPGMKREDIQVTVENGTLTISGERQAAQEIRHDRFHRLERSYGRFSRSFTLPATLDASRAEASCQDGVLTVAVPSREEAKPKQIKVETC